MHTLILLITLSLLTSYTSLQAASFRQDLNKSSAVFCSDKPLAAGERFFNDAQIELAFIKDAADPKAFANTFAEENGHRGYAFGTCIDKREWIVSTPAPQPLVSVKDEKIMIQTSAMKGICARFDVDALVLGKDAPLSLIQGKTPSGQTLNIAIKAMGLTTVSLTCHPKNREVEGPELWALNPLAKDEEIDRLKADSPAAIMEWINTRRQANHLSPLKKADANLQAVADAAAQRRDLHHPRALLLEQKKELQKSKIELLGENRAAAGSYSELLKLLWSSPQHRRLLLHPDANLAAYSLTEKNSEKLFVMIAAKQ